MPEAEVVVGVLVEGDPLVLHLGFDLETFRHHLRHLHALCGGFKLAHPLAPVLEVGVEDDADTGQFHRLFPAVNDALVARGHPHAVVLSVPFAVDSVAKRQVRVGCGCGHREL